MLQYLIIQFPFYYLAGGGLLEVKNQRKFQTPNALHPKSDLQILLSNARR